MLFCFLFAAHIQQQAEDKQAHADTDADIRKIEHREIDEQAVQVIHHHTGADTVDQVANTAAHDQNPGNTLQTRHFAQKQHTGQHIEMIAKIPEYHPNRAEQQAAQPQPEPQEAPQQPAPQPVEQPAPAPQPETEPNQPIPEDVPAPQPAAPEESYPAYEEPEYYEAEPEEPAQPEEPEPALAPAPVQPLDEEKIDTVEFAFAPKTKPILPDDDNDMPSVAGLYGGDMPEKPAKKSGSRSRGASARSTGKNARKTKSPAKAELDAFDDIDYDV